MTENMRGNVSEREGEGKRESKKDREALREIDA